MVTITLLGRDFDVAPYKLGSMRKAAPFVDRVNATIGSLTTMEGAIAVASDLVGFVQVGLVKIDPTLTVDQLEEDVGYDDLPALQAAFTSILQASGMRPKAGEVQAPPAADPVAASSAPSA